MTPHSLEVQILDYLQTVRETSTALFEGTTDHVRAKEAEALFTGGVHFLRTMFPNPVISRLATALWDTIEQKVTPVCWGINVKAPSFIVTDYRYSAQAMIALPQCWSMSLGRDPITQVGILVFVGSQAMDYAQDHYFEDLPNVKARALAYEAEFLNTVKGLSPQWEPSEYHASVLNQYPEGVATPRAQKIVYPIRSLILA